MKVELYFTKRTNGFDDGQLFIGKFATKKAAYHYVKDNRKFYCDGIFNLCIYSNFDNRFEVVRAQDILNV